MTLALARPGFYDAAGNPVPMADVAQHVRDLLGDTLLRLGALCTAHADDPTHRAHQDFADAANGRIHGRFRIERFNAPVEWYLGKLVGMTEAQVELAGGFHSPLFTDTQRALADIAMRRDQQRPEVSEYSNLLLTAGITALWNIAMGNVSAANTSGSAAGAYAAYNNAQARIGIGDNSTAPNASQTDLQASTNKYYVGMDVSYPSVSANAITFHATFGGSAANYAWNESVVDNCNGSNSTSTTRSGGSTLDRAVSAQGTKASGQTWAVPQTVSLS